jgi:branched-chain amino acid transport system substrate-binding protein
MRPLRRVLSSLLVLLLLAACGVPGLGSSAPIVIGGGFNLSGPLSPLDVPAANGAQLAIREINAAGGINGRPLELKILDGQTDSRTVTSITNQLIQQERAVAVIGFTDSDSTLAAGNVAQQAGVPFITVGATSPKLPQQVGEVMFLASFGDNAQAAVGAEFAYKQLNFRSSYLLWDKGTIFTTLLADYFKSHWRKLAGQDALLGEDTYQFKDTDYSAHFIYVSAMPDDIGTIIKQMREAGINAAIVGGDGYDTPQLVKIAGPEASNNVHFATHMLVDPENPNPAVRSFIQAYKQEYGIDPENAFTALGYDTVYLLADAIKRAGGTDSRALIAALESTQNFPAITGKISFSAANHVPEKGITMITIKDGKFTFGGEFLPKDAPAP